MIIKNGTSGNDIIIDDYNNNYIDGGLGLDTVIFSGTHDEYTITKISTGWTVNSTTNEADTLVNIERIQFNDASIAIDTNGVAGQAYRIYQAAFDRTPDSGGLGYWIKAMDQGKTVNSVAKGFVDSIEFKTLYGSDPTNDQIVTKLYNNVLHRAPEKDGYDYWLGVLNRQDATVADVLAQFSESPENVAALAGVIDNGIYFIPFIE